MNCMKMIRRRDGFQFDQVSLSQQRDMTTREKSFPLIELNEVDVCRLFRISPSNESPIPLNLTTAFKKHQINRQNGAPIDISGVKE